MESDQDATKTAVSSPKDQGPVKTWLSSSKRGGVNPKAVIDVTSRFQGDGVRFKAKLIGVDPVQEPQGDKMCLDSMMKLKGQEVAGRSQGKHKQRVWLKVSTAGLKIVDERTGVVEHDHECGRISSLRKDESDPRALSYVYHSDGSYKLFYIKMANLADPVLTDITEVCQSLDEVAENNEVTQATDTGSLLLLDEDATSPTKGLDDLDIFNPRPSSPTGQPTQVSSREELMDIFSLRLEDPPATCENSDMNLPRSPQQTPSLSQILYTHPIGGSPYTSPTSIPWGQQGPFSTPPSMAWGAQAPGQWSPQPGVAAWPPGGMISHGGAQMQGYGLGVMNSQLGGQWGQTTASYPPAAINYIPFGGEGVQQPVSPTTINKPPLG
ncbi:disabled homolog 2-like [Osmerus eperlanus]|uniref:disabled homolog 2-like n=1 Tax=Osmerus eperlanus TaxID=29151 RepID=UPI002E166166